MDSEKALKLEHKLETGESPTDEGPFYHHSWWESYKGSIKGKVGGIVIGAVMGAIVGAAVAMGMAFTGFASAAGLAFAGLTGAGILYGVVEFGEIGKIVGAQAATQEQAEVRQTIRFAILEKKLDALASAIKEKSPAAKKAIEDVDTSREQDALDSYRKTHYAHLNGSTKGPIFWKIALIGLAVGVAGGAVLAIGGAGSIAAGVLEHTIGVGVIEAIGHTGIMAASMTVMGLFGASFGINRDIFRKIFDTTDLWTKGILSSKRTRERQQEAGMELEKESAKKHSSVPEVATIAPVEDYVNYPTSSTHHRDRVLAAAEKALLSMDHTRATPH
jgi:hypothetical protein